MTKASTSQRNRGFTIIELLVAVGVVSMVMVAVTSGVATSLKNSRFSKEKSISVRLAQEGVEWMRENRDKNGWNSLTAQLTSAGATDASPKVYCLPSAGVEMTVLTTAGAGACTTGENVVGADQFMRTLTLSYNSTAEEVRVASRVYWDDGSGDKETILESSMKKWR